MELRGVVVVLLCLSSVLEAQLQVGFYQSTCPQAESVVGDEGRKDLMSNVGLAAGFVRMHLHDCFVRTGGMQYQVPGGRRDGRVSLASEVLSNLPGPTFDVLRLTQSFAKKGLTQDDMDTLSGAHTIGRSHCASFAGRLYNFNSTASQDPSLDAASASQLKQQCPQGSINDTSSLVVFMDPGSPYTLDAAYYANLLQSRGLFTSDQVLAADQATVRQNAAGGGVAWKRKFAAAMTKMGQIGVLTGSDGERRANCRVIN